jgi:hypothetical protein
MNEGTVGTGQYEGLTWTGKNWADKDGNIVRLGEGGAKEPITVEVAILKGIGYGIIAVLLGIGVQASILLLGTKAGALPALLCAGCAGVFGLISLVKISTR